MCPSAPREDCSIVMVNRECDRDESWFIRVAPTVRFFFPTVSTFVISLTPLTTNAVRSLTYTPVSTCSFSSSLLLGFFPSRSRISSL